MKTYSRNYIADSDDFKTMCRFLVQEASWRKENFVWHIARLVDWKYNLLNFRRMIPSNLEEYTRLWFNSYDELVGFVISEEIDQLFHVFTKKGYEDIYEEMTDWYIQTFGEYYDHLETVINDDQKREQEILQTKRFEQAEQIEKTFVFDTSDFKDYEKSFKGLTFQSMKENQDYEALRDLRDSVWPKEMNRQQKLAIRAYTRKSPLYRDEFNFLLVNQEGKHLSGCEAFIDRENNTSEIERVCTHKDHWNKGYSRMMLQTTMKKLYESGIKTAYITGTYDKTHHLYGDLGHKKEVTRLSYRLNLG